MYLKLVHLVITELTGQKSEIWQSSDVYIRKICEYLLAAYFTELFDKNSKCIVYMWFYFHFTTDLFVPS